MSNDLHEQLIEALKNARRALLSYPDVPFLGSEGLASLKEIDDLLRAAGHPADPVRVPKCAAEEILWRIVESGASIAVLPFPDSEADEEIKARHATRQTRDRKTRKRVKSDTRVAYRQAQERRK